MAVVIIDPLWNAAAIIRAAGGDPINATFDPQSGTLSADVSQQDLEAAAAAYDHDTADLTAQQTFALNAVKEMAGTLRRHSITDSAGKDMAYIEKRNESARWQATIDAGGTPDPEDFPWAKDRAAMLSVESGSVVPVSDVIAEWTARADDWGQRGRQIEVFEETFVFRISNAATAAEVASNLADARQQADQLAPST